MIIELTKDNGKKVTVVVYNIIGIEYNKDEWDDCGSYTGVSLRGMAGLSVKETPHQIQELILLDEFAKVALGGLLSNSNHAMSSDDVSQEAYAIAKSMIEARREALND